jgi:hypothetical protein
MKKKYNKHKKCMRKEGKFKMEGNENEDEKEENFIKKNIYHRPMKIKRFQLPKMPLPYLNVHTQIHKARKGRKGISPKIKMTQKIYEKRCFSPLFMCHIYTLPTTQFSSILLSSSSSSAVVVKWKKKIFKKKSI